MITAIIILAIFFIIVGSVVGVGLYRSAQVNKQFQPVPGIPGCTVVATPPATAARFGQVALGAARFLADTGLFSYEAILAELGRSANIVSQTMVWVDRMGQKVGGSTEYIGMMVSSDYSSMFHEEVNLMQIRKYGDAQDTKEAWQKLGLWEVDNAFRSWLSKLPS